MGDITRRDFIGGTTVSSLAAILAPKVTDASTLLSRFAAASTGGSNSTDSSSNSTSSRSPTASTGGYDTLDSRTKKMLEELSTATEDDIQDYKPRYHDNATIFVNARIKGYNIEYMVCHNGVEELRVKSGNKYWEFWGRESFGKGITHFRSDDYPFCKTKHPIMEYATPVCKSIRGLLGINAHLQKWKGKNLTPIVNALSKKALSVKDKEFKVEHKDDSVLASYKKDDFTIEYELNERDKKVYFTLKDGKNSLRFYGPDKNVYLCINFSDIYMQSGKLTNFPRKVYDKASALRIVNEVKKVKGYLASTINSMYK